MNRNSGLTNSNQGNSINDSDEQYNGQEDDENQITLLKAKQNRKKIEENYQTLLNRISLLEAEEKKAQKNFEETKDKARKIMDLKIRNKQQEQEKQKQKQQEQEEINKRNEQIKIYNEVKKDNQKLQKDILIQNLARQVAQIKDEKVYLSKVAEQINQEEKLRQTTIVQNIKNSEKELQIKKKQTWEQKQIQAQQEYEKKLKQEQEIKEQRLKDIAILEQKEIELIKRLQNTRNLQQQAMEEFENVCQMDLDDEMIIKHQQSINKSQYGKFSSGKKK